LGSSYQMEFGLVDLVVWQPVSSPTASKREISLCSIL
jgi:hypothetical protein